MQQLETLFRNFCVYVNKTPYELKTWEPRIKGKLFPALSPIFFPSSENEKKKRFMTPEVDHLFSNICDLIGLQRSPLWPEEAPYAVCITHDVDRILSSIHALKRDKGANGFALFAKDTFAILRKNWNKNSYFNFDSIEKFQTENNIPTTLFVLFEKRRLGKALDQGELQHLIGVYSPHSIKEELKAFELRGNEVGLHTSFDGFEDLNSLQLERQKLLGLGIQKVMGVRNHYLNYNSSLTEKFQKQAGFSYDSTLGFNFQNGFRIGTSFPILRNHLLELPLVAMDSAWRAQGFPKNELSELHTQVRNTGGVFMLNWHFHTMNSEIFPREWQELQNIVELAKKEGAYFACPREVYSLWQERYETIFSHEEKESNNRPFLLDEESNLALRKVA